MRLRTLALLAIAPMAGCYPFISTGTFNNAFCDLDEDGDGAVKCEFVDGSRNEIDCDDSPNSETAALKYPDNTEIPYDGVDNDCTGGDDIDVDNDGFPGISREDYEALGRDPWPGGEERVDCDDEDASIFPEASDEAYDGIDADCAGDCDYDDDGDGFADSRQGADNDCGLPATDCLDSDPDINPDATNEVFYDGEDQDCDGVNDFDPDGDGQAWAGYESANGVFLDRYGYADTITAYTECYDIDDADLPDSTNPLDPKIINTNVAELYYDGVDGNCSDIDDVVENDFDRDGDGFMRAEPGDRASFLAYVDRYVNYEKHDGTFPYKGAFEAAFGSTSAEWAAFYDTHDNDCNDADPGVHPGALERLGDSIDQDCDGGVDTTPFQRGGFTWDGVGNPMVRATDTRFVVTAVATEGVDFGSGALGARVAAFSFPLDADGTTSPRQESSPSTASTSDDFSPSIGMVAFAEGYYIAHGFVRSGNTRLLGAIAVDSGGKYSDISVQNSDRVSESRTYTETDMQCTSGSCWVASCDGARLQVAEYSDTEDAGTFAEVVSGALVQGAEDCFVAPASRTSGTDMIATVNSSGAVQTWVVDGAGFIDPAGSNPFSSLDLVHSSSSSDGLLLGGDTGITLWRSPSANYSLLRSRATTHADGAADGTDAYVAAIGGRSVFLTYGNPAGTMTEVTVPFADIDGTTWTPNKVSIEANGTRAVLVITGVDAAGDDVLAWAFFEI